MRALNREELEERKRKVLQFVIHEYIRTSTPVGSNSIATISSLGLSPATIRNVLSELEKEELISHPHTSAGRIPTDKGYRHYVDSLVDLQRLAIQEETRIHSEYEARIREIEDLLLQTSKVLSNLSHYSGFVVAPKWERHIFSHMELVPVSDHRLLCAMISESGLAKHFIINTHTDLPRESLRKIVRMINQSFHGFTLQEVKLQIVERLEHLQEETKDILILAKEIGQEIKRFSSNENELYFDGASNILSLPDFTNPNEFQNLFKIVEEKQILSDLVESDLAEGRSRRPKINKNLPSKSRSRVKVRIGSENTNSALQNLSVISTTYQLSDKTVGVLGILGPKRMEYSKMISLVDYVSQTVNKFIQEFEKDI